MFSCIRTYTHTHKGMQLSPHLSVSASTATLLLLLLAVLLLHSPFGGHAQLTPQPTVNVSALPPVCLNCSALCENTTDPLTVESVFHVNTTSVLFSRYSFRRILTRILGITQYSILDNKIAPGSYSFSFSPTEISRGVLTNDKVCAVPLWELRAGHTCCLSNAVKRKGVEETETAEQAAQRARQMHQKKLIAAWVILAVSTACVVLLWHRDRKDVKDSALESAMDLAEQRDDDED